MKRILLMLTFLLTTATVPAFADTVQITSGTISSFGLLLDTFYGIGGGGVGASGTSSGNSYGGGSVFSLGFAHDLGGNSPIITVPGNSFALDDFGETGGSISLLIGPYVGDPAVGSGAVAAFQVRGGEIYTAPRQLGAPAPPKYDLVGHGTVTLTRIPGPPPFTGNPYNAVFTFSATPIPEPSSLALLAIGVIGLAVARQK